MTPLDEALREFLVESQENLDELDRGLVALEQRPNDQAGLAAVFRTLHTIKGSCGFFDFPRLSAVAHAGEGLLSRLRDGQRALTPAVASGLLAAVDDIRQRLAHIEQTGADPASSPAALVERLTRLQTDEPADEGALVEGPEEERGGLSDRTIRVDVDLLDRLMNLVGELVLARNQVLQYTATHRDPTLLGTTQRLNLLTTELQESVMKTRMRPVATVWGRFPRLARDVAVACAKPVRLTLEGGDTELDKSIIEAIQAPLTHLLRNSIDHGIEPAAVRRARGKPAEGQVVLRAFHEGGQVNLEVIDDGGGIDPERVVTQALERGLVTREQAARMTEGERLQLIFLPGLSTAEQVTSISGRGVGMDVVRSNIEKISGVLDVQSQPGRGTTVRIKIPLTLAIIPALLVHAGGECFAIPQASLLELVRLEGAQARRAVETVHDSPVYRLRGRLLPLVSLNRELGLAVPADALPVVNIVVLRADDRPFGLVVDSVSDTEEIVVKPLGQLLKGAPLYAGATILGDGRVALILDVFGLARVARLGGQERERGRAPAAAPIAAALRERQGLLLVRHGEGQVAISLSQVARLEEVRRGAIEQAAGREVIQYRGEVLPLVHLADVLGAPRPPGGTGPLQVVVYCAGGRAAGLIVGRVLDILEAPVEVQPAGGTAILQGRVTDLLDLGEALGRALPGYFPPGPAGGLQESREVWA